MNHIPAQPISSDRFFAPSRINRTSLVEKVAVVASMTVIVLLILVDVVRTAPPDASFTEITFDASPDTGWAQPATRADARGAAAESAQGSRTDAMH